MELHGSGSWSSCVKCGQRILTTHLEAVEAASEPMWLFHKYFSHRLVTHAQVTGHVTWPQVVVSSERDWHRHSTAAVLHCIAE